MIQGTPNSCLTVCCAGSANQCAHMLALVSHVGQQREQLWVVFGKLTRARNDENESENELVNPHGLVTQQRFLETSRKSCSDCNQEMLLPPLHRWCVFSLSTSPRHPSLPLLPSSVLSLSLSICESAYPSTPLSLSFFSLISFILTTTNFQLVKHTHTHCHLFRNNVE